MKEQDNDAAAERSTPSTDEDLFMEALTDWNKPDSVKNYRNYLEAKRLKEENQSAQTKSSEQ